MSFKHFPNEEFRNSLTDNQIYVTNDNEFNRSCKISIHTLNKHSYIVLLLLQISLLEPIKPFITKELSRQIMKRSRLRNNFLRKKTDETATFM